MDSRVIIEHITSARIGPAAALLVLTPLAGDFDAMVKRRLVRIGSQLLLLVAGEVDLVAAQVTARSETRKFVDFTNPTRMNVSQILVTGAGEAPLVAVADLSGREVFVRDSGNG